MPNKSSSAFILAWDLRIRDMLADGMSVSDIRGHIETSTNTTISPRTFRRRLQDMGVTIRQRTNDSLELRTRITYIFSALRLTDHDTVAILESDGYKLSTRALQRIRKELGLYKRTRAENFEALDEYLREIITAELDKNEASSFGKGNY